MPEIKFGFLAWASNSSGVITGESLGEKNNKKIID